MPPLLACPMLLWNQSYSEEKNYAAVPPNLHLELPVLSCILDKELHPWDTCLSSVAEGSGDKTSGDTEVTLGS